MRLFVDAAEGDKGLLHAFPEGGVCEPQGSGDLLPVVELAFLLRQGEGEGDASAFLPYAYVGDDARRIEFHRRLAECSSEEELSALREEMSDRFGAPPPALDRLYRTALCRILAAERGITRIRLHEGLLYLYRTGVPLRFHGRLPAPAGTTADELLDAVIRLVRVRPKAEPSPAALPG